MNSMIFLLISNELKSTRQHSHFPRGPGLISPRTPTHAPRFSPSLLPTYLLFPRTPFGILEFDFMELDEILQFFWEQNCDANGFPTAYLPICKGMYFDGALPGSFFPSKNL
jgi:hypothetical protein